MPATSAPALGNGTAPQSPSILPDQTSAPSEPADAKTASLKTQKGFTWHETLVGTVSIGFWIVLLDFGYLFKTSNYAYVIAQTQGQNFIFWIKNLIMLLLSFSVSNVALLCCLCGFLGAMADRSDIDGDEHQTGNWNNLFQKYSSAVLRGFFVFLVLMSGILVVTGTDLAATTPQTYGHQAGTASLFSFLIGYDAQLFTKFVKGVYDKGLLNAQQTGIAAGQKVDEHLLDIAPDGSKHEEVIHAVTSASLSSSTLNNIPNAAATPEPVSVGEGKPSS